MFDNQIFTPKQAAAYLQINPQVLLRLIRKGEVPAKKIGRQWRLSKLALDIYIEPNLVQVTKRLEAWNKVFKKADELFQGIDMTDEEVLKAVTDYRKEMGFYKPLKKYVKNRS